MEVRQCMLRVVDHRGHDARFQNAGLPQLERKGMVAPVRPADLAQPRDADAELLARGGDAEPAHAGDIATVATTGMPMRLASASAMSARLISRFLS